MWRQSAGRAHAQCDRAVGRFGINIGRLRSTASPRPPEKCADDECTQYASKRDAVACPSRRAPIRFAAPWLVGLRSAGLGFFRGLLRGGGLGFGGFWWGHLLYARPFVPNGRGGC